jgi:hypothetical protein
MSLAYRRLRRQSVILNTKTGKAFRGILWAQAGPLIVLRHAEVLEGTRRADVDGEVIVERSNVDFLQVLERVVPS